MSGKHKFSKVIRIAIFTLVVWLTGYALVSSGNMRNPFSVFTALSQSGGQTDRAPQIAGATDRRPPDAAGNGARQGGASQGSLAWSQIGGVLLNVWFLFATANVVIVVQTLMGYVKERLRPKKRRLVLAQGLL